MPVEFLPDSFYLAFLSDVAKARQPSPIRSLLPLEATPGLLSLLAGKPNPTTFPFTSFSFTAQAPPVEGAQSTPEDISLTLSGAELAAALQYGPTGGMTPLVDWLHGLQQTVHGRRRGEGWTLSVGSGSQDLLSKAIIALLNPGDAVLVQSPVYAGVIPLFHSLGCDQIEVDADADGISTASLRSILEAWPVGKPKPKVLYTIPYGGNPTGATASLSRRKEVLQLAREHNFLIMEDDPYFYLFYGQEHERPPSYFSLECASSTAAANHPLGRVLRFDSLSKILSAGLRIGIALGPAALLRAIDGHTATANLQPASLTQAVTYKLLEAWGHDGFLAHTRGVSAFYRARRDVFEAAMQRHLAGLAEWEPPQSGLFFWFKLLIPGVDDAAQVVRTRAFDRGVLALPGTVFLPNGRATAYVRAAFSLLGAEEVDEALKRLREAILDARAA